MKDQLIFDVNNADTIADTDSIGAFVRAGDDGTLITHGSHITDDHDKVGFDFVDGDVSVANDEISEVGHGLLTGAKVQLTSTGTLPAGLALATDYFVIKIDNDTIQLASSLANADAGTAVDITAAAGGGTHTLGTPSEVRKQLLDVALPRLEQIEDSAHVSGDRGIMSLGVRQDTEAALAGDGDYIPLSLTSTGRLRVDAELDADFDFVYDEDSAHSSSDPGSFSLSIRMDDVDGANSALLAGTEGDYQGFFTNAKGELHVRDNDAVDLLTTIDTDTGVIAGDTTSIDSTLTALSKAEDSVHGDGDQGIMSLAVRNDTLASLVDADGDYAPLQVNASGALYVTVDGDVNVNDAALANTAIANTSTNVGTSATDLLGTDLADRKYAFLYNNSNRRLFVGGSAVTLANGFPVSPGSYLELRAGASIDLHAISPVASKNMRILELS